MASFPAYFPDLLLAWVAYLVLTVSPGPANLAIVATSMEHGRKSGLFVALGVIVGSQTWAILAALGLSAFLFTFGWLMEGVRIAGALYLLWLGYNALRSALHPKLLQLANQESGRSGLFHFTRGLAIHLTNPKAIFGWLAIISIGVKPEAPGWISFYVVLGCLVLGSIVFGGYAYLFSTRRMVRVYLSFKKWIDGATAAIFGFAGVKLLLSR